MAVDALHRPVRELLGDVHPCPAEVIGAVVGFGAEAGGGDAVGGAVFFNGSLYRGGFFGGEFSDGGFDGLAVAVSVPFVAVSIAVSISCAALFAVSWVNRAYWYGHSVIIGLEGLLLLL